MNSNTTSPQYPRGTNKLQIAARELFSFTSRRMTECNDLTTMRIASLATRCIQLMWDSFDTTMQAELTETKSLAEPWFKFWLETNDQPGEDFDTSLKLAINSVEQRSQVYENGKMQRHANFCRCLALFLKPMSVMRPAPVTEVSRAVVKAFYAGADRDKLQHAVMLLF